MLGRLEFRGVGRQKTEPDAVGRAQPRARMPTGAVEHQDDGLVGAGADRSSETIEHALEPRDIDAIGQPPLDRAGRRPHETIEIKPFVLVRADRHRALTAPGPNPPDERLQAEAMLVEGP